MNKINVNDIKNALKTDHRFRALFPELASEIAEFLQNPGCPCTDSLLRQIKQYDDRLAKYFPGREVMVEVPSEDDSMIVINCKINELEAKLKKLLPGKKNIVISRYEDQITAVIQIL